MAKVRKSKSDNSWIFWLILGIIAVLLFWKVISVLLTVIGLIVVSWFVWKYYIKKKIK